MQKIWKLYPKSKKDRKCVKVPKFNKGPKLRKCNIGNSEHFSEKLEISKYFIKT